MENETLRDLKISGITSTSGGLFHNVRIDGIGKVVGDLECVDFHASGKSNVNGNVKTNLVHIQGMTTIQGNMQAKKAVVHGHAAIKGYLMSDDIEIHGSLSVKGNCDSERFFARGSFSIEGLLNADMIDVTIHGYNRVREIGGAVIRIRKSPTRFARMFKFPFFTFSSKLVTDSIEGDEIVLEWTQAKIVRGNHITIGPGCEIGRVEYKNDLKVATEAKVKEHEKI
jgi:cytoskeletal protein CcmA (bactofilin family)